MIPVIKKYPHFEKGSASSEYQQIINFCVNYLDGLLLSLMHMDIPPEVEQHAEVIKALQQQLVKRERTVRHSFQFQIEKYFADFKSTHRTRIRANHSRDQLSPVLTAHKSARIQKTIELIGQKHQQSHSTQLQNTGKRLKTLVHRSDEIKDANPLSPTLLCNAFLASIEFLNVSGLKTNYLFALFDNTLEQKLTDFYQQIDLGLYYLDILAELTDPSLLIQHENIELLDDIDKDEIAESDALPDSIEAVEPAQIPADAEPAASIQKQIAKKQHKKAQLDQYVQAFKVATQNGNMDYLSLLSALSKKIKPVVENKQKYQVDKFSHFFTSLLNNDLLSIPFKTQLSRLSGPLLQIVLVDPFLFRSSEHPVNNFLLSMVDFELRFKHQGEILAILTRQIESLLELNRPALSDYQTLIKQYESFKNVEIQRLNRIQQQKFEAERQLKQEILQLINDITAELVVDHDTMLFFYDDWQLYLLHLAQKNGLDSAEFKQSVELAKRLIWAVDENKRGPHPDYDPVSFKSLLIEIDKGLFALKFSSEHRHRTRKQLVKEYKRANEQEQSFSVLMSAPNRINRKDMQIAAGTSDQGNSAIKPSFDQIAFLNIGDWVEIRSTASKAFTRAKLQSKSTANKLFTFIDQRGHKIKEINLVDLEKDFSSGNIRLLKKTSKRENKLSTMHLW